MKEYSQRDGKFYLRRPEMTAEEKADDERRKAERDAFNAQFLAEREVARRPLG